MSGAPQAVGAAAEHPTVPTDRAEVCLGRQPGDGWDEALRQTLAADGQSRSQDNVSGQRTAAAAAGRGEEDRAGTGVFHLVVKK